MTTKEPKKIDRELYRKSGAAKNWRFLDKETMKEFFRRLREIYDPKLTDQALLEKLGEEKTGMNLSIRAQESDPTTHQS